MGFDYSKYKNRRDKEAQHAQAHGGGSSSRMSYILTQEAYEKGVKVIFLKKEQHVKFQVIGQLSRDEAGAPIVDPFRIPDPDKAMSDDIARSFMTQTPRYGVCRVFGPKSFKRSASHTGESISSKMDFIDEAHPDDGELPRLTKSLVEVAPSVIAAYPQYGMFYYDGFDSPLQTCDASNMMYFVLGYIYEVHEKIYLGRDAKRPSMTNPVTAWIGFSWVGLQNLKDQIFAVNPGVDPHDYDIMSYLERSTQNAVFQVGDLVNPEGSPVIDLGLVQHEDKSRYEFTITDQQYALSADAQASLSITPEASFNIMRRKELLEAILARSKDDNWSSFIRECAARIDDLAPIVGGSPRMPQPGVENVPQPQQPQAAPAPRPATTAPLPPAAPVAAPAAPCTTPVPPAPTPTPQTPPVAPAPPPVAPAPAPQAAPATTPTQSAPPQAASAPAAPAPIPAAPNPMMPTHEPPQAMPNPSGPSGTPAKQDDLMADIEAKIMSKRAGQ